MDQYTSDDRLTKMRSVMSIRCLPKISPSSSTSPVHRLPLWGDLWREQTSRLELGIFVTVDGKNVRLIASSSSPNPVKYDNSPHRHSQRNCLIYHTLLITLYIVLSVAVFLSWSLFWCIYNIHSFYFVRCLHFVVICIRVIELPN